MTPSLEEIIKQEIRDKGPMDLGRYMGLCLAHPKYGYYMTRDPFGVQGDFTTAPEISQVFGEMISVWIMDTWAQMGCPDKVTLLECGAGRGTLMKDALRVISKYEEVAKAVQVHLLEISPVLKEKQKYTLQDYDVTWHQNLKSIPNDDPMIIIGNEFLDALPVRQLVHNGTGWDERKVTLSDSDTLGFDVFEADARIVNQIQAGLLPYRKGDVIEVSPEQKDFLCDIKNITYKQGVSALFIDYGFTHNVVGDTLQAVKNHAYCNLLESPGEADITAHVNFSSIADEMMASGLTVHGAVSQAQWLNTLNATIRFDLLIDVATRNGDNDTVQKIQSDRQRLMGQNTKKGQMGALFKVIAFTSNPAINLAGFS